MGKLTVVQGCGKTTLCASLEALFGVCGERSVVFSIDDFYLPAADQRSLALSNPGNELLRYRGNAGTHDLPLLRECLAALKSGEPVLLPVYDKALLGGRGDRADPSKWKRVEGTAA